MAAPAASRNGSTEPGPRAALLAACADLLAEEAPSGLSGRRIAVAAGVNYAQIHRHFGSKNELCRAVLDELGVAFEADAYAPGAPVPEPGVLQRHPTFVRVLARLQMDEASLALRPGSPTVRRYRAGLGELLDDGRPSSEGSDRLDVAVALSCSMQLGLAIHRTAIAQPIGLRDPGALDRELWLLVQDLHRGAGVFADVASTGRALRTHGPIQRREGLTGRALAEARLLEAAARLLADRAPSAISGRMLAAAAGVNYGLIHHYFGSAAEVVEQASRHVRDEFYEAEGSAGRPPDFFSMSAHPGYVRALTQIALDADLAARSDHFPVLTDLLERRRARHGEPTLGQRCRLAIAVATQLAWTLFERLLSDGLDRDVSELRPGAAAVLARMVAPGREP